MSLFSELKKGRESKQSYTDLVTKIESESSYGVDDPRFWKLDTDKAGNGMAIIRFLFAPQGETIPWVKYYEHAFRGPGGWYIDKCGTSVKKECPICKFNSEIWAEGSDASKNLVRTRKRKLKYISNILIIKDPSHPEKEGKVFLFRYGKKIYDKIVECIKPKVEFEDEEPNNPFDFWSGCNFRLKQSKVEDYPNYDRSAFDKPSSISNDDDEIERIWNEEYKLIPFLTEIEETYNYQKQTQRLNKVLNTTISDKNSESVASKTNVSKSSSSALLSSVLSSASGEGSEEEEFDVEYFRKLAADD